MITIEKLNHHLSHLREKHQEIDNTIDKMERSGHYGDVDITELKKQRLKLKDEIETITKQKENLK